MQDLFVRLTNAVEGAPAVAIAAAFAWGVLSILLSPCHLASIPLVVGFIGGQGRVSTWRALLVSTFFSVGILVTIAAIGAVTAAAGRMLGDLGPAASIPVMEGKAVLFKAFGDVDGWPVPLDNCRAGGKNTGPTDPQRVIDMVCAIAPMYAGINL